MPAARIVITGLVQGVFFRAQAKEKADELALTGWVRNNNEGSVEIVAQGPQDKLKELEAWCHTGPAKAKVTNVTVTEEPEKELPAFEIWY
ncbi:MAG: acylphosphatase [Candidatus Peribacteraceae bacterium]|nr:acylphosphatase [Candidatus Peribacteraceae bacterium]